MEQTALPVPDDFNFPFEPYEIQKLFMENLFRVIDAKKIGMNKNILFGIKLNDLYLRHFRVSNWNWQISYASLCFSDMAF